MRPLVVLAVGFLAISVVSAEGPVTAKAVGIQVNAPLDAEAFEQSPLSGAQGVTVIVLLSAAADPADDRFIVSIDTGASELIHFLDAEGNDLLDKSPEGNLMPFSIFPKISKDARYAAIELHAPGVPVSGCGSVTVMANLVVSVAKGKSTVAADNVSLKAGTVASAAEQIIIDEVGVVDWNDTAQLVTFKMEEKTLRKLAEVRFRDESGTDITGSQSRMNLMGSVQCGLIEKAEAATVEFVFFDQVERVEVPVELTITMGL